MIAAQYTQGKGFRIGDAPRPDIGADEVLLRVDASSICATDIKIIRHGHRKLPDGRTIILGHEFVGTIEQVGRGVDRYCEGMRVGVVPNMGCGRCTMCRRGLGNMCPDYMAFGITQDGGHAPFVRITPPALHQGNLLPLPEGIAMEEAALAEPLSCAVNGVRVSRVEFGDVVVVNGAGPMGLLNIMLAAAAGASKVFAVDVRPERLAAARMAGAADGIHAEKASLRESILQLTSGRGADVVINTVPSPQVQQELLDILAPFGRLCLFAGWPKGASGVTLDTNPIHYKNLTVTGMTGGSANDYSMALALIAARKVDLSRVISDVVPLSEMDRAYELALSGERLKVVMVANT
jgi:threonine dehydrogenase-like Zn-dependent dehydrogenase